MSYLSRLPASSSELVQVCSSANTESQHVAYYTASPGANEKTARPVGNPAGVAKRQADCERNGYNTAHKMQRLDFARSRKTASAPQLRPPKNERLSAQKTRRIPHRRSESFFLLRYNERKRRPSLTLSMHTIPQTKCFYAESISWTRSRQRGVDFRPSQASGVHF